MAFGVMVAVQFVCEHGTEDAQKKKMASRLGACTPL